MNKRHSIVAAFALFALAKLSPAQNIDLIEYFIDVDPGVGMGTQIAPTQGSTINESVAVPVATIAALSDGNHLLVCRVRDSDGDWSVAFARTFLKSNVTIDNTVPNIVDGEYFFDTDPGQGNGTQFTLTPGTAIDHTVNIPAATILALSDGVHRIATRVKDDNGNWSAAFTRVFRKSNFTIDNTVPNIVDGEYFFDSDPGPDNGSQFNVTLGTAVDLTVDIPAGTIAALSDGFHRLATRVRDDDGDWSAAFTRVFLKMADPPPPPPELLMQRIDYRWLVNGVPVGNEISLLPGAPAKVILFTELASLAGLQQGQTAVLEVTPYDTMGNRGVSAYATVLIDTVDGDGDGVPDQWELTYGFNANDDTDMALDSDGDGLDNENEFISGTNPLSDDTDGDGMNDSAEVLLAAFGFDPTVDTATLRDSLYAAAVGAGLYSESEIRNLNMLVPLIARDPQTGEIFVRFRVQETSELLSDDWSQFILTPTNTALDSGDLLIEIPVAGEDTLFIRVLADESLQFP